MKWCHSLMVMALLAASPAHAVKLYKWIDENGSTHYNQAPPPKGSHFVEEKEFDGETNVVPGPATETAPEQVEGAGPATPQEADQQTTETGGLESPASQEKAAIAEKTDLIEKRPKERRREDRAGDVGADLDRGARTGRDARTASGGVEGASAGTAAGAAIAPGALPAPAPAPGP